jgi:hypothetical protein
MDTKFSIQVFFFATSDALEQIFFLKFMFIFFGVWTKQNKPSKTRKKEGKLG